MLTSNHSSNGDKVDRISCLPRPIIHDILSLLPTEDATRTSLVSKTFYSHWTCFPAIDLNFYLFNSPYPITSTSEAFIDYAVRTIQRRRIDTDLRKFQFTFPGVEWIDYERQDRIREIISYAIEKRVKDLTVDLSNVLDSQIEYLLPLTIEGPTSVTELSLMGAELLNFSEIGEHNWPRLVNLQVSGCSGLGSFKLSSNSIESIEFEACAGLNSIAIESASLEIFDFTDNVPNMNLSKCEIGSLNCRSLKELSLSNATISDGWISDNIPTFSVLEKLVLIDCNDLENPKLWNDNLKYISVNSYKRLRSIDIRSENLQSLVMYLFSAAKIIISPYKHLRELYLGVYKIDPERAQRFLDEILTELVANSIGLESLYLSTDLNFNRIEFKHERLKSLELDIRGNNNGILGLGEVVVETPRLVSLNYSGRFIAFQLVNSDALLDTQLAIQNCNIKMNEDYFIKLWNLIASVRPSRFLTLSCSPFEKYLIVPEEMREALRGRPLDNRHHLNITFDRPGMISAELMDSLLWLWPSLKTLCLDEKSIKLQHGGISEEEEDQQRCWRFTLRTVELNKFDAVDSDILMNYFKDQAKNLHDIICN